MVQVLPEEPARLGSDPPVAPISTVVRGTESQSVDGRTVHVM